MPDTDAQDLLYFIRIEEDAREAEQNLHYFGQHPQSNLEAFLFGDSRNLSDMVPRAVTYARANQWISLYRGARVGFSERGHVTFRPRDIVWSRHPQDLKLEAVTPPRPAAPSSARGAIPPVAPSSRPAPDDGDRTTVPVDVSRQDTLVIDKRFAADLGAAAAQDIHDVRAEEPVRVMSPWLRTMLLILIYIAAFVLSFLIADYLYTLLAG